MDDPKLTARMYRALIAGQSFIQAGFDATQRNLWDTMSLEVDQARTDGMVLEIPWEYPDDVFWTAVKKKRVKAKTVAPVRLSAEDRDLLER